MYATIGGIAMHYTIAGRGIPCLIPSLAGTPIYERTFSSPALLAHLRLIFVELRANRTPVGGEEGSIVRMAFRLNDTTNRTLGAIAEQMNAAGHRTARGAHFTATQVQRIIQRRKVYAGLAPTTPSLALNAGVMPAHPPILGMEYPTP